MNIRYYSMTSERFSNFYRDEVNDCANENNGENNFRINNNKTTISKSFEYKTKLMGRRPKNYYILDAENVVPS